MRIKAYTIFTPSHKRFLDEYLLNSFKYNPNIELTILHRPQLSKTAEFRSRGWKETVKFKVECFHEKIRGCNEHNELFMFIDTDIVVYRDFYEDIIQRMQNFDALFQYDGSGSINSGFFVARNNERTRNFFYAARKNFNKFLSDQPAVNFLLQNLDKYPAIRIKWDYLPKQYWTYGMIAEQPDGKGGVKGHWLNTDTEFPIPDDIILHHGNWTRSKEDKYKILDLVRTRITGC